MTRPHSIRGRILCQNPGCLSPDSFGSISALGGPGRKGGPWFFLVIFHHGVLVSHPSCPQVMSSIPQSPNKHPHACESFLLLLCASWASDTHSAAFLGLAWTILHFWTMVGLGTLDHGVALWGSRHIRKAFLLWGIAASQAIYLGSRPQVSTLRSHLRAWGFCLFHQTVKLLRGRDCVSLTFVF